jgi:hypothetical protein
MRPRQLLAEKLSAESEPYGFSLVTWGVGALLIEQFGVPGIAGVLAYLVGAVAGFAVLAAVVFDHLFGTITVDSSPLLVASAIHLLSTVGTLLIAHVVITLSAGQFSQIVVFALAGLSMSASYNLLLTAEALFARVAA